MIRWFFLFLFLPTLAFAQTQRNPCFYSPTNVPGSGPGGSGCVNVGTNAPLPVIINSPAAVGGNASGTTGAVVGTLAASTTLKTYICGFTVSALGTAGSVGPITISGLAGGSQTYQAGTLAAGVSQQTSQSFTPCLPSSAVNTAINTTTTADATATAVNVNSWGYQAP